MTPAREDALEATLAAVSAAEAAAVEVERQLAAFSDEVPTDAMLDVYSSLRAALDDDKAPLNERLQRVFKEVRIAVKEDTIGVLPVLREDVRVARLNLDEKRSLIRATVERASVALGRGGADRIAVDLFVK